MRLRFLIFRNYLKIFCSSYMCNIKPTLGGSKLGQIQKLVQKFDQGILNYMRLKNICAVSHG